MKVLNQHASIKMKYLRANHSPFVTKESSKAIMLRSKLQNPYLKCKSEEARALFNPIQDRGWRAKRPPTSFCPVTSTNVGIRPQHFLTFSFNPFATLV